MTGFDGNQHTLLNKVVTVVCRWLKNDDDAVLVEGSELREQQLEAINVILNLSGSMSVSPSEEIAAAEWLSLAMST